MSFGVAPNYFLNFNQALASVQCRVMSLLAKYCQWALKRRACWGTWVSSQRTGRSPVQNIYF